MNDRDEVIDELRRLCRKVDSVWNLIFVGIVLPIWLGMLVAFFMIQGG